MLDGMQVFSTGGLLGLLPTQPNIIYFYNETEAERLVTILVGRTATSPVQQKEETLAPVSAA